MRATSACQRLPKLPWQDCQSLPSGLPRETLVISRSATLCHGIAATGLHGSATPPLSLKEIEGGSRGSGSWQSQRADVKTYCIVCIFSMTG